MGLFDQQINSIVIPDMNRDRTAIAVCSVSGLNLMSRQKIKLTQIKQALQSAISEAERASKMDDFMSKSLLVANLTKASCDAFIEMAGALGKVAGLKNVDVAAKGLTAVTAVAGSTAAAFAGQKTDWISTGNSVLKATNSKIGKGDIKDLADLKLLQIDIVNAAVREDSAKALQVIFLKYIPKIGEMSLKYMKENVKANWLGAVASVANAGLTYSKSLDKAFDARLQDMDDAQIRKDVLESMRNQISQVLNRISEIDKIMSDCTVRLG